MEDLIKSWQSTSADELSELKQGVLDLKNKAIADDQITAIAHEVAHQIDCLQCANCCKTTPTTFELEDISRASKKLGIGKKEFIKKYLFLDIDGIYTTISTPCPMLEADNKCRIYEARPLACQSFPHTQRPHFFARTRAHISNLHVCPITYHVVKQLLDA